jgi:hypothetical protein
VESTTHTTICLPSLLFGSLHYLPQYCDGKGRYLLRHVSLFGRIILETDASIIAGKVATHSMDADAPLSEQVMQLSIFLSVGFSASFPTSKQSS